MANAIPALNSYGLFTVLTPFVIDPVNYKCSGLQSIDSLLAGNFNVYDNIYAPVGLTINDFNTDKNANVIIVTLDSNEGPTLLIPSSYIDTMPALVTVPYSHLILTADIGELPDSLPIAQLKIDIKDLVDSFLGVDSTIDLYSLPGSKLYSLAESETKEIERELNISYDKSPAETIQNLIADLTAKQLKITELENIIKNYVI